MNASIISLIGNTPIVKIGRLSEDVDAEIYVKLEYLNPTGSHKDRIAYYMIKDAEQKGLIKPGDVVVEASSGNTAISIAWVSSILGYRAEIFIEEGVSEAKISLIRSLGARVIRIPSSSEEDYARAAEKYAEEHGYVFLNQYENEANVKAHYETTGPEIYRQLDGRIDAFVMGIGTGGTIAGVGRFLREKLGEKVRIIGVTPKGSKIAGGEVAPERIEGLASDMVPGIWERYRRLVDEVIEVSYEEALQTMKKLIRYEGVMGGLSTGANIHASLKVAKEIGEGVIVTLAPDSVLRYPHLL